MGLGDWRCIIISCRLGVFLLGHCIRLFETFFRRQPGICLAVAHGERGTVFRDRLVTLILNVVMRPR